MLLTLAVTMGTDAAEWQGDWARTHGLLRWTTMLLLGPLVAAAAAGRAAGSTAGAPATCCDRRYAAPGPGRSRRWPRWRPAWWWPSSLARPGCTWRLGRTPWAAASPGGTGCSTRPTRSSWRG
ncbi:hypothetical protein ACFQVA_29445 [Actinomadura keratinilytica]